MPLNRLDQAAISVNRDILANFAPLLNKSEAVANYVADQLMDWKTVSETFLEAEFPFSTYAQALSDWAHVIGGPSVSRADLKKAVALFISARAREQKRPCYLINFSTGIQTLELSDDMGTASLINFLKMSFHGGTDVAPALDHALEIMERDAYQKADLLIISDFIMAGLPETVLADINSQRANGNRFFSLVVGSTYMTQRLQSLFDHEWVFDPETSRIHELVGFQERMQRDTNNPVNATW